MPRDKLIFQAVKHKYIEDADGEATLILKVNMKDKLVAFAIPTKVLLNMEASKDETN